MSRRPALALTLSLLIGSIGMATHAGEPDESSFAPVYDGPHVLSSLTLPQPPSGFAWTTSFMEDTSIVLGRYGWYLAEMALLVDATGQVRDVVLIESMPTKNLSATIVEELRRKKWSPGVGPSGPVPAQMRFRILYSLQGRAASLDRIGRELRRNAKAGQAGAQYQLGRIMQSTVAINHEGFDSGDLIQRAAEGGSFRAMLALGSGQGDDAKTDRADAAEKNRRWLLKAAAEGHSPTAQLLIALHAWAERTDAGYARSRHWLEAAEKAKEPASGKYLAALLVSHSSQPEDWKRARALAEAAALDWHDKADPDAQQIVAAASALVGDFKAAIDAQTNAIARAEKVGWPTDVLQKRLAAYRESVTVTDEIVMIPAVAREAR